MKRFNFWRSLFFSALAVVAFGACSDDDDNNGGDIEASITVNGAKAATLGIKGEGGETEAVSVVSSGVWTLTFDADQDWCVASATSGKGGTSALTFTVAPLPEGTEERSAVATLTTPGQIFGVSYTETATITIEQSESGEVTETVLIYKETFGTDTNVANTDVDKYTDWTKTGEGAADVTYVGSNVSVRKSSPNTASSYEGASAAPILFFGKVPATFTVQNITLTEAQTRLQLTFGGQQTIDYNAKDYTWSNANLLVALSADGETWSTVQYTTSDGDQNRDGNNWVLATADFTLKAPTSKLFIRFTSPVLASNLRIDDITLQTGKGGEVVDLEAGDPVPEPTTAKIAEIATPGDYKVEGATIVATYAKGFVMQDATGTMLVFLDAAPEVAVGDVVTVQGIVASYGGVLQFDKGATIEKTGTAEPAAATPVAITADNIEGYMTKPVVTFVKMTGTLVKSGTYYNVTFTFDSKYTGSISSPNADLGLDTYVGNIIDIEGWFVNNGNAAGTGTYFTIVATKVANNAEIPSLNFKTVPEIFAGSDPEPQKIEFIAQNIPTDAIVSFTFDGDDKDKFDVESQDATSVTIKPVGNNTSSAAYSAKLVASYNNATLAELSVAQNPAVIKNYVPFTTAPADWSGEYVVGYPDAANKKCYIVNEKYTPNGAKSTFTYTTLEAPKFDGTKIIYDASYHTITLAKIEGTEYYSLKYGDEYVGWESNTGNSCQFKATAPTAATTDSDYQWSVQLDTTDNLVHLSVVTTMNESKPRRFQFNTTAGQERFAIYAGTQKDVMLYQLEK
ncbi:MAG: hypothetical protein NC209_00320 [Alistipes sp.]|nr:hypothetical protein [Alistipes senegalensis]MCM1249577.1 hypothetical protein [Alistipes sp.]